MTTTTESITASDTELAEEIATLREAAAVTYARLKRLEWELTVRLQERGATSLLHPSLDVKLKSSRNYDPDRFRALFGELDLIEKRVYDACYEPEHPETVTVKAKVNGTAVKALWKAGGEIAERLTACLLPSAVKVEIERRK